VIEDSDSWTLQLAITRLLGTRPEQANVGVAGALIAAVPVVILLVIFQRQIVRGLTAGAVKG
jgi:sn-glycerol 3-phosphate transport system permease protein